MHWVNVMWLIATNIAHSMVCACVGRSCELCKNGWTDRDTIYKVDSCGLIETCVSGVTHCRRLDNLVSRNQKGKPLWILLKQEIMRWQWHQLDHMQIICTTLQTDNRVRTDSKILFSRTFQDFQRPNSRVFQDQQNPFSRTFQDKFGSQT